MKLHFFKLASLVVLALLTAACANTVKTRVSTFSAPAGAVERGSLVVQPAHGEQQRSLEFAWYREKVENALRELGYTIAAEPKDAEFVALLDYGVETLSDSDRGPYFTTGWGFGRSRYFGSSVVIVDDVDRDEFLRRVSLVIERNNESRDRVYEVSGVSEGHCGVMTVVFDEMLGALLQGFPVANASVKTVSVRGDTRCQ